MPTTYPPAALKAFRLADNKTAELAQWDFEKLEIELAEISQIDMREFGFDMQDFESSFNELLEDKEIENQSEREEINYYSKDEIIDDLQNEFQSYSSVESYVKNIMSVPKAKYQFNRLCAGYNDGYNISLLFNPHRLDTATKQAKSIFNAINNDDQYRKSLAKYMVNVQNKVVTENEFYKFIGIGSGGIQYVNEFPPYLARDIYKKYVKSGFAVLDPCSGWGGRTIGLASCLFEDVTYITTDPSTKTYNGLLELKEFLKPAGHFEYHNLPFEEFEVEENSINFCFTSPPYFDTEKYSDEETQSYKTNNSYEEWKKNFLYMLLEKVYFALKPKHYCLLNVGKVRYPIDADITEWLKDRNIKYKYVKDFKIGGNGLGSRTDDDGSGEPFIEFQKE